MLENQRVDLAFLNFALYVREFRRVVRSPPGAILSDSRELVCGRSEANYRATLVSKIRVMLRRLVQWMEEIIHTFVGSRNYQNLETE